MLLRGRSEKCLFVENPRVNHVRKSPYRNQFALPVVIEQNDHSIYQN
jgi:hypothetical protein